MRVVLYICKEILAFPPLPCYTDNGEFETFLT